MSLCYELVRVVVNREMIEVRCHLPAGHKIPHEVSVVWSPDEDHSFPNAVNLIRDGG